MDSLPLGLVCISRLTVNRKTVLATLLLRSFSHGSHHQSQLADITKSRILGLSCFCRYPDWFLLQLLCLVGQCYTCNLLIVEVIVNRMYFLLRCCRCCYCSSFLYTILRNTRSLSCLRWLLLLLFFFLLPVMLLQLNRSWIKEWPPVPGRNR